MESIRIRAVSAPWYDGIELLIIDEAFQKRAVAKNVIFEEVEDPTAIIKPTMIISQEAGQQLMDELWHCGLRPTEGHGSAGQLGATQSHLEDMRKIAFNLLEAEENT